MANPAKFVAAAVVFALATILFPAPSRAAAPQTAAGGRGECRSAPSQILKRPVPFCIVLPPGYDADKTRRYPVLYFFHGLGENERVLLTAGGFDLVNDLWADHRIGEFLIVTPAADSTFDIDSYDGRTRYEDFLLREFLPYIESHYRARAGRASRGLGGISMGGYGALHLAFQHPELFGSVSVHSAALIQNLPALTVDNSPGMGPLRLLGNVFGSPPNRVFWDRNNPLVIARTANLSHVAIYFDCGMQDDYGFNVGAQALHDLLASRHIVHEFHLYPGGHDWNYFAAHMPASLEAESRAFGLAPAPPPAPR